MWSFHDSFLQNIEDVRDIWKALRSNGRQVCKTVLGLLTIQITSTVLAQRFIGFSPHDATNADLLYRKSIALFLCLFLSIQYSTIPGFLLGVYNTCLLAVILHNSTVRSNKPSWKDVFLHGANFLSIVGMRMLLGDLFSRGTGWACPPLFFNDAIHETTYGLAQVILYCISLQAYNCLQMREDSPFQSVWRTLLLWLPNILSGSVFFWSFSTVSITGINGLWHVLQINKFESYAPFREDGLFRLEEQTQSNLARPLVVVRTFLGFVTAFAVISLGQSVIYQHQHRSHSAQAFQLPESTLVEFLVMSYPRPSNIDILSSTLETYIQHLGTTDRASASIYTTAPEGTHESFTAAAHNFKDLENLRFHQDKNPHRLPEPAPGFLPTKQTFDLYSALSWMDQISFPNQTQTRRYIGIMEDDFEWCDGSWQDLTAVIYEVSVQEQQAGHSFCGLFIATGGSGLLVRPETLSALRQALQEHAAELNTDIIIQKCLLGELDSCAGCSMAASRRMLLRHTGAMASTYENRSYPEDRWQCGWRQPFNGHLGVWVP